MFNFTKSLGYFLATAGLAAACGKTPAVSTEKGAIVTRDAAIGCAGATIEAQLKCVEGLTFTEVTDGTIPAGYRRFDLQFTQPTDHLSPDGETFQQKLILWHRTSADPMVLQTSGYNIYSFRLSGLASQFQANQLQVEHRFFATSTPASADWTKLDIRQSAADFHRITRAFKSIYHGKWVNTGASKGGMTSVYHKRFYPQDLDGTLALVAPLSFSPADERYVDFVDNDGGAAFATCRAKLEAVQKALLTKRNQVTSTMTGNFSQLGGADVALEHAVLELPFVYFQYQDPRSADTGCDTIPAGATASVDQLVSFLAVGNDPGGYNDEGLAQFTAYYFQAAHELGSPASKMSHLQGLLKHADTYNLDTYLPAGVRTSYLAESMLDVRDWAQGESDSIMWVYGELDPWSAGAFKDPARADDHLFVVPGGNHGSTPFALPAAQKAEALKILGRWLGKPATHAAVGRTLEDDEAKVRRPL